MGKLVLIRHGQSIWNKQNRFTGWADVSLSQKGLKEARMAARKLKDFKFDTAFTSHLIRAQETLFEILNRNKNCNHYIRIHEDGSNWYSHYKHKKEDDFDLKVYTNEALNERYYGDLQGLNKDESRAKFGSKLVHLWRRSYTKAPPGGNPLKVTYKRTIPYYKSKIEPRLRKGENIIVAAHGNSLRSIIKYVENISDEKIADLELETGVPYIYNINNKGEVKSKKVCQTRGKNVPWLMEPDDGCKT